MSDPVASIIIRCYNEREHIGKLLHGLFEQNIDNFEVILVDSGSTDGTLDIARQYPIEEIVYIDPEEFSFGRALNYGCEAARGDYCVFASAHVYPKRTDWLQCLLEKFENNADLALVYGKQRGNHVTRFPEKRVFKRWFPDHDIEEQQSPFCNNANCAIRRDLWEEFKYDEQLTGLEDLDWAQRIQEEGYDISYCSNATIIHVHDESPREIYDRYRREAIAHSEILPEQEFTFTNFLQTVTRNVVVDYVAAVRQGELTSGLVDIPLFRFLQFWGTYKGFNQSREVSDQLWRRFYYPDTKGYPQANEPGSEGDVIDYDQGSKFKGENSATKNQD